MHILCRVKTTFLVSLLIGVAAIGRTTSAADEPVKFGVRVFAEGFVSPTGLVPLDNSSGIVLVADQAGTIDRVDKSGKRSPFADLRPRITKLNDGFDERGLLSMALHPKFAEN